MRQVAWCVDADTKDLKGTAGEMTFQRILQWQRQISPLLASAGQHRQCGVPRLRKAGAQHRIQQRWPVGGQNGLGNQGFAHQIRSQALQALTPGVQRAESAKQRRQDLLLATGGSPGVANILWHRHLAQQGGQRHQSHSVLAGHFRQEAVQCFAPVALLVV